MKSFKLKENKVLLSLDKVSEDYDLRELCSEERKGNMTTTAAKTNESRKVNSETIIEDLGGCGKYQVRLTVLVHLLKTVFCFSTSNLLISTVTPTWWCVADKTQNNLSDFIKTDNVSSDHTSKMSCRTRNDAKCTVISYDDSLTTLFDLICDLDFIPSTINSLQLAGQLTGSLVAGQLADLFGRKRPFFASVILLPVLHIVGFFSVSWEMFAVSTFFTGMAATFYFTIMNNLVSEFTLAQWRVWVVGFPSWQIQQCLYSLIAWLLHDWRYLQLMTAVSTVPCLFAFFFIPESFRWYIAHDKPKQALKIINTVAKYNRRKLVNIEDALSSHDSASDKKSKKYSLFHLFKSKKLVKITLVLMVNWFALGIIGIGLYFGIQRLSGNMYLNMFLFSLFGIPSKGIALWLQNRIGRRYTTVLSFVVIAVAGFTVGILQTLDAPRKDLVTNILAITANAGISVAWSSVQTMTVELYPTVIRNLGYGTVGTVAGFAAILGSQLVYLESYFSGLLYYVCGAVAILCVLGTLSLPETKDRNLQDKIVKMTNSECASTVNIEEDREKSSDENLDPNGDT